MPFKGPYTKLYCHLVWATWDRLPLISEDAEPRLHAMIRAKLQELECVPVATGGIEDHVHVLCRFPPFLSISELVKRVKGASSHLMNHEIVGPDSFRWQATYGAFTIGERAVPKVRAYILQQREHHAGATVHTDWERVWIPDGQELADDRWDEGSMPGD